MSTVHYLLGLSRVPHSLMDVALPAFCAIAWLGAFPSMHIMLLGLMTATAAYLAVYGLNDLVDLTHDREKTKVASQHQGYIDALLPIHPVASGKLSFKMAVIWVGGLACIAILGAYALNPVTLYFFGLGLLCEQAYCFLFKKNAWRVILSGIVKACGPMAAIFAVDHAPNLPLLALLFSAIFCWEIGGQNIPADWVDLEQDQAIAAKTFPIQYGATMASLTIMSTLMLSMVTMLWFLAQLPHAFSVCWLGLTFACGSTILLVPAYRLFNSREPQGALLLFNHASYYPLCLCCIAALKLLFF